MPPSMLEKITPVILTSNEAPNIGRTLERLAWSRDAVVVDNFSDDETVQIVGRFPKVRLFQRTFDTHAQQWNHAIAETDIGTEWVLALDADYIVLDELVREIAALVPEPDVVGYRIPFTYCIDGRPLHGTVYPPTVTLYRKSKAKYIQDGHAPKLEVTGRLLDLENSIWHDDRKRLSRWLMAQTRYMRLEAEKLREIPSARRTFKGRLRRMILIAPVAMFFYCMFVKGNVLDGRAGLFYALQRSMAEAILSLYLLEAALSTKHPASE